MTTLTSFQQDLKNGMTIHDALCKHGLTFKQAVLSVSKPRKKQKKNYKQRTHSSNEKYIIGRDGHYYLRKNVNGSTLMFGTYKTLEDAIRMRNHCIEHGWKQKSIDRYCEVLGIERCKKGHNSKVRYH